MLVFHFNTYGNGVKTICKPNPNSLGILNILQMQNYVKLAFLGVPFQLGSEGKATDKGTQYLELEMR